MWFPTVDAVPSDGLVGVKGTHTAGVMKLKLDQFSFEPARSRRRSTHVLRFASINSPGVSCTKYLFDKMSNGRGRLSEDDVLRFAKEQGLPDVYVSTFYKSLLKASGPLQPLHNGVTYTVFHRFVTSREAALKRVFQTLDTDNDGKISVEDMRIGLSHMVVRCPNSRCCYRPSSHCVGPAISAMQGVRGNTVSYCTFRKFFLLLPEEDMLVEYWLKAGHPSCCDVGVPVSYPDAQRKSNSSPWGHLLAGAMAGATSRTATAPLETMRLMAMTGRLKAGTSAGHMLDAASRLVRQQGWRALYRGNGANVVRSAPQKALDFFVFDMFKNALSNPRVSHGVSASSASAKQLARGVGSGGGPAQLGTMQTLAAAGCAGAVSNMVLYPLEVVRTRLSTDTLGIYNTIGQTFTSILRKEGWSSMYRGMLPSVAAILPEAAITYGMFDVLKRCFVNATGQKEAGVVPSLSAGVLAAFMGQAVAYPLETVSRRMQIDCSATPLSPVGALADILRDGGPRSLFRGLGAASIRVVPMAVVSFGTYEFVRMHYTRFEEYIQLEAARAEQELLPSSNLQCAV